MENETNKSYGPLNKYGQEEDIFDQCENKTCTCKNGFCEADALFNEMSFALTTYHKNMEKSKLEKEEEAKLAEQQRIDEEVAILTEHFKNHPIETSTKKTIWERVKEVLGRLVR